MREITLSNGKTVSFDESNPESLMDTIIVEILNPYYEKHNDWNQTIKKGLEELDGIIKKLNQPRIGFVNALFSAIEKNLHTTIQQLTGVDKVEILFLNIEDYIKDILSVVEKYSKNGEGQEAMRNEIADILKNLNIFEMGEITIFLAKEVLKNQNKC